MTTQDQETIDMNERADWCRNFLRVYVIPANGKKPIDKYQRFLDGKPVESETHVHWIRNNYFDNGITAICGRMNYDNRDVNFTAFDLDNEPAIQAFTYIGGKQLTLQDLADTGKFLVDQTEDKTKAHVYVHTTRPLKYLTKYNGKDSSVPIIEIKNIIAIAPTPHSNGSRRQFLNDDESIKKFVNDLTTLDYIENHVNDVMINHGQIYLDGEASKDNRTTNSTRVDHNEIFYRGSRHTKLLSYADSVFIINHNKKTPQEIKQIIHAKNQRDCRELNDIPAPLEYNHVEQICIDAEKWAAEKITKEDVYNDNGNNEANQEKQKKQTKSDIGMQIAEGIIKKLFMDEYKNPYAVVPINDHLEIIQLSSRTFRNYLAHEVYKQQHTILDTQTLKDIIGF